MNKDQGRFSPTLLGERVSGLLMKSFEDVFDVGFTARMEEELDEIEEGKLPWRTSVQEFWDRFTVDLDKADAECCLTRPEFPRARSAKSAAKANCSSASAATDFSSAARAIRIAISSRIWPKSAATERCRDQIEYCDNCGKEMLIKRGRFGTFLACSGYPDCKTTRRMVRARSRRPARRTTR